jgi:hypothetical protein
MHKIEQHVLVLTKPRAQHVCRPPELAELISQNVDLFICGLAFAWHRQRLYLENPDAYFSYFGSALQLPNQNLDRPIISFPISLPIPFHISSHAPFIISFTISNLVVPVW